MNWGEWHIKRIYICITLMYALLIDSKNEQLELNSMKNQKGQNHSA